MMVMLILAEELAQYFAHDAITVVNAALNYPHPRKCLASEAIAHAQRGRRLDDWRSDFGGGGGGGAGLTRISDDRFGGRRILVK